MLHAAMEVCQPGDILVVTTTSESTDGMFGELLGVSAQRPRRRRSGHRRRGARRGRSHRDGFPGVVEGHLTRRARSRRRRARSTCRSSAPAPPSTPATSSSPTWTAWSWCARQRRPRSRGSASDRLAKEQKTRERLRNGELGLDFYGLRAKLAELGVQYVDESEI